MSLWAHDIIGRKLQFDNVKITIKFSVFPNKNTMHGTYFDPKSKIKQSDVFTKIFQKFNSM